MQIIPSLSLRKAGPSISGRKVSISAPLELTQDVKRTEKAQPKQAASSSCKPSSLHSSRPQSRRRLLSEPTGQLSEKLVSAMQSEIDDFLSDVKDNGFVLQANESSIDSRLEELELHEHILSPIAETEECPGGFNPMTLTYSLPQAKMETKPELPVVVVMTEPEQRLPVVAPVPEVPVKNARRAKPSNAWARLGSRKYYFVGEDRIVTK